MRHIVAEELAGLKLKGQVITESVRIEHALTAHISFTRTTSGGKYMRA